MFLHRMTFLINLSLIAYHLSIRGGGSINKQTNKRYRVDKKVQRHTNSTIIVRNNTTIDSQNIVLSG
jgi:hypothetical protein